MGLDYLMKKVWHPGSMKNIEKVWEAQEKQREIDRKHLEMKKKLQEQRHNEQLKKLQVEAGLIPRSHLDRMDWMYDWGNRVQNPEKNAEQYLMGKPADSDHKKDGREVKQIFKQQITNAKCEDFALTHQDPMFAIMMQEKKTKQAIQNNPLRMKEIYDSIEGYQKPKELSVRKRSSSKQKKNRKHKKDKHPKRYRSGSSSTSRSKSRDRRRDSRSRSRSREQRLRKAPQQSEEYKDYLKQRFGPILVEEDGYLRPDFSKYKKKYKTDIQLTEEDRRQKLKQMMQNGKNMYDARMNREEKEPYNKSKTGDHFMDVRKKQIEVYDLQRNLARGHKKRKGHDDE